MFEKVNVNATIKSGIIAACGFLIPTGIYIYLSNYNNSWLLYLGTFLFMFTIGTHTYLDSKQRAHKESTVALIFASHMATIAGIALATFISLIFLIVFIPGFFDAQIADKTLTNPPSSFNTGKTKGLAIEVIMASTILNFSAGSFVSIILPFYAKRNQTRDKREPTPLHQHGKK